MQPEAYPEFRLDIDVKSIGDVQGGYRIGVDYPPDLMRLMPD